MKIEYPTIISPSAVFPKRSTYYSNIFSFLCAGTSGVDTRVAYVCPEGVFVRFLHAYMVVSVSDIVTTNPTILIQFEITLGGLTYVINQVKSFHYAGADNFSRWTRKVHNERELGATLYPTERLTIRYIWTDGYAGDWASIGTSIFGEVYNL